LRYAPDKNVARKNGRTDEDYFYIPCRLSAGDKNNETIFLITYFGNILGLTPWIYFTSVLTLYVFFFHMYLYKELSKTLSPY
jgi:hypothetical protein